MVISMRRVTLTKEDIEQLYEKGIHLTQFKKTLDFERRGDKEFFYPEACQVGSSTGLWGGNRFPLKFGTYSYSFSPLDIYFSIGNYCSIATGLRIMGYRHPMERFTTSSITYDTASPLFNRQDFRMKKTTVPPLWNNEVKIESDVWVGANVTLKRGITLHTGCVVGANFLVTHDVPPYAVVGGVPAKLIKYRFDSQLIKMLLESKWFDYDVNYLDLSSDTYAYDFVKYFLEHREDIPKLSTVRLSEVIADVKKKNRRTFITKMEGFLATGALVIDKKDMKDGENFFMLLETMCRRKCLGQNAGKLMQMCFGDKIRLFQYQAFLLVEADERVEFFSTKEGDELWLHYVPYLRHGNSRVFEVPVWGNGKTWPGADRENKSAFAAYMRIMGNDVYISIEFSAKDTAKARILAQLVGFEEKNSPSSIIRLLTKRIPIEGAVGMEAAVKEALDEFCAVGEKLVAALDSMA